MIEFTIYQPPAANEDGTYDSSKMRLWQWRAAMTVAALDSKLTMVHGHYTIEVAVNWHSDRHDIGRLVERWLHEMGLKITSRFHQGACLEKRHGIEDGMARVCIRDQSAIGVHIPFVDLPLSARRMTGEVAA